MSFRYDFGGPIRVTICCLFSPMKWKIITREVQRFRIPQTLAFPCRHLSKIVYTSISGSRNETLARLLQVREPAALVFTNLHS